MVRNMQCAAIVFALLAVAHGDEEFAKWLFTFGAFVAGFVDVKDERR